LRTCIVILHILVSLTAVLNSDLLPHKDVECKIDFMHQITSELNTYMKENIETRQAYMIMCGLMMDVLVIMVFVIFALRGTTWRIVIAIAFFQVLKYICAVSTFDFLI